MDDRGLQSPRAVGRFFSSSCRAEPSEDAEIFDSDDGLPSLSKILARSKRVIDLTLADDGDGDGDDEGVTEVSWLRKSRTARPHVRLIPPSIDRFQIVNQLPSALTVLVAEITRARRRRPYNVVYSGHTWLQDKCLEDVPSWFPLHRKLQQHSTAPLQRPTVDVLHASPSSLASTSIRFGPSPKDSTNLEAERLEISSEILETQSVAIDNVRCEGTITARTVMLPLVYVDASRPRLTELRRGESQWEGPNRNRA